MCVRAPAAPLTTIYLYIDRYIDEYCICVCATYSDVVLAVVFIQCSIIILKLESCSENKCLLHGPVSAECLSRAYISASQNEMREKKAAHKCSIAYAIVLVNGKERLNASCVCLHDSRWMCFAFGLCFLLVARIRRRMIQLQHTILNLCTQTLMTMTLRIPEHTQDEWKCVFVVFVVHLTDRTEQNNRVGLRDRSARDCMQSSTQVQQRHPDRTIELERMDTTKNDEMAYALNILYISANWARTSEWKRIGSIVCLCLCANASRGCCRYRCRVGILHNVY